MKNGNLKKVFVAMLLAAISGFLAGPEGGIFGIAFVRIFGLIGQLFLNALMLVVVPLVVSSIVAGVSKIGGDGSFGRLGVKTIGTFLGMNFLAILTGAATILLLSAYILPAPLQTFAPATQTVSFDACGDGFQKFEQMILKVIPSNIVAAASSGQMIGLIVFSLIFGYFASRLQGEAKQAVLGFWNGIFSVMMSMTHFFMKALPFGVFGLVAKTVAISGFEAAKSALVFFLMILLALAVYLFFVLPLLLKCIAKVSPFAHFRAMAPALVTAFSTSSSAATLPVTFECVEKRAGISNRIASFVLPLGISLNLSGTSLYQSATVLFLAFKYGQDLDAAAVILVVFMSLMVSFGVAGVPSACLIGIVMMLPFLDIPAEAIGLIMAVERILDMCRTSVSVFGGSCSACIVAASEGEKNILKNI